MDQTRLDELTMKAATKAKDQASEIEKKVGDLRGKIELLLHARGEVLAAPITKAEALERAVKSLRSNRANFFEPVMQKALEAFQLGKGDFFEPAGLRLQVASDLRLGQLVYALFSESDLEKAANALPALGMPAKEREKKISAIDQEIQKIEAEVEKILS
jgi:hypothetical protein